MPSFFFYLPSPFPHSCVAESGAYGYIRTIWFCQVKIYWGVPLWQSRLRIWLLLLQWRGSLLGCEFEFWPGNFHTPLAHIHTGKKMPKREYREVSTGFKGPYWKTYKQVRWEPKSTSPGLGGNKAKQGKISKVIFWEWRGRRQSLFSRYLLCFYGTNIHTYAGTVFSEQAKDKSQLHLSCGACWHLSHGNWKELSFLHSQANIHKWNGNFYSACGTPTQTWPSISSCSQPSLPGHLMNYNFQSSLWSPNSLQWVLLAQKKGVATSLFFLLCFIVCIQKIHLDASSIQHGNPDFSGLLARSHRPHVFLTHYIHFWRDLGKPRL